MKKEVIYFLLLIAVGVGGMWLGVVNDRSRKEGRQLEIQGHFTQLALALHNYYGVYNNFPPIVQTSANGTRHSWRVLLLPYNSQEEIYSKYDFNQPWDSSHNSELTLTLKGAPSSYKSYGVYDPFDPHPYETSFVAVDGKWPVSRRPLMVYQVFLGDDVFTIAEVVPSGIHWMEPRDIPKKDE